MSLKIYLFSSLENYYQEAGRAGRDGLESECIMFYTYADTRKHEFFLNWQNPEEDQKSRQKLQSVMNYWNLTGCRTKYLLNYFWEKFEGKSLIEWWCGHCDNCLWTKDDFVFVKPKKVNVNNLDYNKIVFEKLRNLRKIKKNFFLMSKNLKLSKNKKFNFGEKIDFWNCKISLIQRANNYWTHWKIIWCLRNFFGKFRISETKRWEFGQNQEFFCEVVR